MIRSGDVMKYISREVGNEMSESIQKQIQNGMVAALKGGDKRRKDALSFLLAEVKGVAKDRKIPELPDTDTIGTLQKQLRKVQETEEATRDGKRPEAHEQAVYEIALIREFLPDAPSEEAVEAAARAVIADLGASSIRDMGKVMAEIPQRLPGVDKGMLSGVVKRLLSQA